jgi:hypothetical protein
MMSKRMNMVIILIVCTVTLATVLNYAADEAPASAPEFKDFKIILDRNVFDPSRSQRSSREERGRRVQPPDRLALMGVLIDNGKAVAFFEGSQREYNTELQRGETIDGYTITNIRTDRLIMQKGNQRIDLPVGSSLTKRSGEDWALSSREASEESSPRYGSSDKDSVTSGSIASGAQERSTASSVNEGSSNDIMKKLMERRRQEVNNEK